MEFIPTSRSVNNPHEMIEIVLEIEQPPPQVTEGENIIYGSRPTSDKQIPGNTTSYRAYSYIEDI